MAVAKENKVVHGNDLTYITQKYKEYFVAKEAGKGLSTNDYTTQEKNKLAGIEAGAQVNDIETIKVNGTALTPDASKAVDITVPTQEALDEKYVPLAGGTMDKDAELGFVDYDPSMMPSPTTAHTHNTTTVEGTGMQVEQSKYTPASQMASGNARTVDTTTKYGVNSISKTVKTTEGGSTTTNTYTLTLPSKNGTVATTADIPTVAGVYAPLASPALTGTPTAPTAAAGTNSTQIATTAFVKNAVDGYLPLTGGTLSGDLTVGDTYCVEIAQGEGDTRVTVRSDGETTTYGLAEIKVNGEGITIPQKAGTMALTSDIAASFNSPNFTGTPTAPTASAGTNNTQVATTAFVTTAVNNAIGGMTGISFNTDYSTYDALVAADPKGAGVIYLIPNSGSSPNIKDEYVWTGSSYELLGTTEVDLSRFDEDLTTTEIEQLLNL